MVVGVCLFETELPDCVVLVFGATFTVPDVEVVPSVAVMVATAGLMLRTFAANRIELRPPRIKTVLGTDTIRGWLLVKRRVTPPVGAGAARVSVPTTIPSRRAAAGLNVSVPSVVWTGENVAEIEVGPVTNAVQTLSRVEVQPVQVVRVVPTAGIAVSDRAVPSA